MAKVICTLENASDEINGVKFEAVEGVGMVSAEISDELAAEFASIPGYEIVGPAHTAGHTGSSSGEGGAGDDDAVNKAPSEMTVAELKAALTAAGKTFPETAKKAALVALLVEPADGGESGEGEPGSETGGEGGTGDDETVF